MNEQGKRGSSKNRQLEAVQAVRGRDGQVLATRQQEYTSRSVLSSGFNQCTEAATISHVHALCTGGTTKQPGWGPKPPAQTANAPNTTGTKQARAQNTQATDMHTRKG